MTNNDLQNTTQKKRSIEQHELEASMLIFTSPIQFRVQPEKRQNT